MQNNKRQADAPTVYPLGHPKNPKSAPVEGATEKRVPQPYVSGKAARERKAAEAKAAKAAAAAEAAAEAEAVEATTAASIPDDTDTDTDTTDTTDTEEGSS